MFSLMNRVFLLCFLITALACRNIAENEITIDAGLLIHSSAEPSVTDSFTDIPGAGYLIHYSGKVFVATVGGEIHRFDPETLQLEDLFKTGNFSPSCWSDMAFSPTENSASLIGNMGNIAEVSIPDSILLDQFNIFTSPVALEIAADNPAVSPGYLWVLDGSSKMHKVELTNGVSCDNKSFSAVRTASCLVDYILPDTVYAGTSRGAELISSSGSGSIGANYYVQTESVWNIARVQNDSLMVVVHGNNPAWISVIDKDDFTAGLTNTMFFDGQFQMASGGSDFIHTNDLSCLRKSTVNIAQYNPVSG